MVIRDWRGLRSQQEATVIRHSMVKLTPTSIHVSGGQTIEGEHDGDAAARVLACCDRETGRYDASSGIGFGVVTSVSFGNEDRRIEMPPMSYNEYSNRGCPDYLLYVRELLLPQMFEDYSI